jgi:peroxiredoxin
MTLNDQLQQFADAAKRANPEFAAAIDRLVARLRDSGAGESAPQLGEPMPSFHLPNENGRIVSLDRLLDQGPVAVTFHRGHWCSYCRISIDALSAVHEQVAAVGGQIVAVTPDRRQYVSKWKSARQVPFPILTDTDNGYALSLNLVIWIGVELRRMMMSAPDIATVESADRWLLPIPATFVVAEDGLIKARFVDPDFRRRMTIEELIAALSG